MFEISLSICFQAQLGSLFSFFNSVLCHNNLGYTAPEHVLLCVRGQNSSEQTDTGCNKVTPIYFLLHIKGVYYERILQTKFTIFC